MTVGGSLEVPTFTKCSSQTGRKSFAANGRYGAGRSQSGKTGIAAYLTYENSL